MNKDDNSEGDNEDQDVDKEDNDGGTSFGSLKGCGQSTLDLRHIFF